VLPQGEQKPLFDGAMRGGGWREGCAGGDGGVKGRMRRENGSEGEAVGMGMSGGTEWGRGCVEGGGCMEGGRRGGRGNGGMDGGEGW
jgi:hypothetical protein